MALFEYVCSSCNKPTSLDPNGACMNVLKSGETCGHTFPLRNGTANSKVRQKMGKHTNPRPVDKQDKDWSWVTDEQEYTLYQNCCALSGDVFFDSDSGYLILLDHPVEGTDIAKLLYANDCAIGEVGGTVLPLNSKLQNMHIHFDELKPNFHKIADHSEEIVIREPNFDGQSDYRVLSGSDLLFSWDPDLQLSGGSFIEEIL